MPRQMTMTERESQQFLELQELLLELPDPTDDALWDQLEQDSTGRLEAFGLSERMLFAKPFDYAGKRDAYVDELKGRLGDLAQDLREGRINQSKWSLDSRRSMNSFHIDAYRLGVAEAKGVAPSKVKLTPAQRQEALASVQEQYDYWAKFAEQIKAQIAEGKPLTTALDARAKMYGGSLKGTAERAKLGEYGSKPLKWVRAKADSCETCLSLDGQIRTAKEWAESGIWPTRTKCLTNCGCSLLPA